MRTSFSLDSKGYSGTIIAPHYNIDGIVGYKGDFMGINLFLGLGIGVEYGIFHLAGNTNSAAKLNLSTQINTGIRLIFGESFAIDFLTRISLMSSETGYYIPVSNNKEQLKYQDYYLGINFVKGKF